MLLAWKLLPRNLPQSECKIQKPKEGWESLSKDGKVLISMWPDTWALPQDSTMHMAEFVNSCLLLLGIFLFQTFGFL